MEVQGLNALLTKLERVSKDASSVLEKGMRKACLAVEGDAKKNCPVDTGGLRASINHDVKVEGKTIIGVVGTNMEHGPYIEFGTGPKAAANPNESAQHVGAHFRNTPWAYRNPKTDEVIWTHGYVGQPFLFPALKKNQQEIPKILANEIIKSIGGQS